MNSFFVKTRKRKIIERSTIFTITLVGFLFFTIFDFGFVYSYRLDGIDDLQWFGFWTHLSNTAALIWITLALISITTSNDKIERFINHWNVKNTIFTFIITTGVIFMLVAYIPTVVTYSKPGNIEALAELVYKMGRQGNLLLTNNVLAFITNSTGLTVDEVNNIIELQGWTTTPLLKLVVENSVETTFELTNGKDICIDPSTTYRTCVIIGTTFKHLIIPSLFIYLGFTEIGYFRTKNISDKNRSMIQFIWPAMYLVYVLTLTSTGLISPPYPVLDFGFTESFRSIEYEWQQILLASIYFVLDLSVGVIFVFTSLFFNWWNSKVISNNPKLEEDLSKLYKNDLSIKK